MIDKFNNLDIGIQILIGLMCIDVILGSLRAFLKKIDKNNHKTTLNSKNGYLGLFKKIAILGMLAVAHMLDLLLDSKFIANSTLFYAVFLELLSLKENLQVLGVDMSPAIDLAIKTAQDKSGTKKKDYSQNE